MRSALATALVFALGSSLWANPAGAEEPSGAILLQTRQGFAFLLGTPTGEVARTSSSEIIRIVSDLLKTETDFAIQVLDASVMSECRGKLGCITLKARRDYDALARNQEGAASIPYREHVRRLREEKTPYAKYLLVVSNVTLEGEEDRMTAVLIDTDLALETYHNASRKVADWQEDVEARINDGAVLLPPIRVNVRDSEDTKRFFEKLFLEDFRATFEKNSHWHPYGEIAIDGPDQGLGVLFDGDTVGATGVGTTRILQVPPGEHVLELTHPEYARYKTSVTVAAGETAKVDARPSRISKTGSGLTTVVFWSGVVTAAAGTALTIYGLTKPDGDLTTACFAVEGSNCSSNSSFVTFGYNGGATAAKDVNPGGIMIAPLGYSLFGAGAVWSIGSMFTDPSEIPWIPVVAGLGLGIVTYGLSAILNGPGLP